MRRNLVLISFAALGACSGAGPESAGSSAPSGGSGATPAPTETSTFVNPTEAKTYVGVGGNQTFSYITDSRVAAGQQAQVFAGHTSTVRDSNISIAYDPRDAIFTLTVADPQTGAATTTRFQDPGSRTSFGGSVEPQWGTLHSTNTNVHYLQAGDGDPLSPYQHSGNGFVDPGNATTPPNGDVGSSITSTTLFYEVPGSSTKYVTYAGYVRNSISFGQASSGGGSFDKDTWHLERGAFVFGEPTTSSAVPVSGTGTYTGAMLATMVFNPTLDGIGQPGGPTTGGVDQTYFQWIEGTSRLAVNFGTRAVDLTLNGTVSAPQYDRYTTPLASTVAAGASFSATGHATIDLAASGGFTGAFTNAKVGATTNGAPTAINIAGSSIDGTFYGPAAEEAGGGFHIVGGTPDQRIDILGAFTGARSGN